MKDKVRSHKCIHKTYKPWTEEEKNYLAENYLRFTPAVHALRLGRTVSSIKNQANKQGCVNHRWSDEEMQYLRNNASRMTSKQIAAHLKRPANSILKVAWLYKISFYKCGDNSPNVKYSDDDVLLIRELAEAGVPNAEIARKFELSPAMTWQLANKRKTAIEAYQYRELPR